MSFVVDLAVILIAVGIFTVLFKALKQPLILGYIVAGFLVGPHLGLVPLTSTEGVHQWSEIGIIFLLFALGLEFSFKKLLKVGSSALITAGVKCVGMMLVGLILGRAMGWTSMESIFLGGLLSMSSTTIIIKAYDDMGLKDSSHATLLFGSLVFEDLIAVLLMVLLSTLAVSNKFAGGEMAMGLLKLGFYIILWFLIGIYLIPTLLKWAHKYLNDEILLLTAIGLCFLMVTLAELAGFSSALGAFVMGSILAETVEGERVEHSLVGVKNLFGAIFFVSVGMMVDPAVIGQHWAPILIITVVAMLGILIFSTSGALLAGQGLVNAVHTGFSLAQLGEFAFIIAGLGCSLGVMRDFIYPVVVAVSVITTFTTPYMIKAADPVSNFLIKHLPDRFVKAVAPSKDAQMKSSSAEKSEWMKLIKGYMLRLVLYGVMISAVIIGSKWAFHKFADQLLPNFGENLRVWIGFSVAMVIMLPFLFGLCAEGKSVKQTKLFLLKERRFNRWALMSLSIIKIMLAVCAVVILCSSFFEQAEFLILLISIPAVILLVLWSRRSVHNFTKMEDHFFFNLNEKEEMEKAANPISTMVNENFEGKDMVVDDVEISSDFPYVGKTLREMPFRHSVDVSVIKIVRGTTSIPVPSGNTIIYPHDILVVVGAQDQIKQFRSVIEKAMQNVLAPKSEENVDERIVVEKSVLGETSFLTNKTLRQVSMKSAGCMIVGIMRGEQFVSNPKPDFKLLSDDCVWVAGGEKNVAFYLR